MIYLLVAIIVIIIATYIFISIFRYDREDEQEVSDNQVKISDQIQEIILEPEQTPIQTSMPMIQYYTDEDVIVMAKILYREARGVDSITEIACVGWTACNRVDAGYGNTITEVLTAPKQFAWVPNTPVEDWLVDIARDVLERWNLEKNTGECDGRVLPAEYLFFHGDGCHNWFRIEYKHNGQYWDYSLPSPYES